MPRIKGDAINPGVAVRGYIVPLLKARGVDLTKCDECGTKLKTLALHHKKYDGATIEDIVPICQSCNLKEKNRHLT